MVDMQPIKSSYELVCNVQCCLKNFEEDRVSKGRHNFAVLSEPLLNHCLIHLEDQ